MADDPEQLEPDAILSVPEIRDYDTINAELKRLLDEGKTFIRLDGVSGQRLLASRLVGRWNAVVDVAGRAGPELAAQTDAPGLVVICRGSAADGAASGLRAGRVLVLGHAGPGFGYNLQGGLAVAVGGSGARAGLRQQGGDLVLLGECGRLAGERQSGGRLFLGEGPHGPFVGRGRLSGRLISLAPREDLALTSPIEPDDRQALEVAAKLLRRLAGIENRLLTSD